MANLKTKAKKTSAKGQLAKMAEERGLTPKMEVKEDPAMHNTMPTMPSVFNQAPPPPPALQYLRYFATVPSLRKATNGLGVS